MSTVAAPSLGVLGRGYPPLLRSICFLFWGIWLVATSWTFLVGVSEEGGEREGGRDGEGRKRHSLVARSVPELSQFIGERESQSPV